MNPNTTTSYYDWVINLNYTDFKNLPYHTKSDFPLDGDGGGDGYGNGYGDGETMGYGNKPFAKFPQYFPAPPTSISPNPNYGGSVAGTPGEWVSY